MRTCALDWPLLPCHWPSQCQFPGKDSTTSCSICSKCWWQGSFKITRYNKSITLSYISALKQTSLMWELGLVWTQLHTVIPLCTHMLSFPIECFWRSAAQSFKKNDHYFDIFFTWLWWSIRMEFFFPSQNKLLSNKVFSSDFSCMFLGKRRRSCGSGCTTWKPWNTITVRS